MDTECALTIIRALADGVDPITGADLRPADRSTMAFRLAFDGAFVDVSGFELDHLHDHPLNPVLDDVLDDASVTLVRTEHGLTTHQSEQFLMETN